MKLYICSAFKDGSCKSAGLIAPRRGGCSHHRPHPADGHDLNNSAGTVGTPCSESDEPCPHYDGPVKCVPVNKPERGDHETHARTVES